MIHWTESNIHSIKNFKLFFYYYHNFANFFPNMIAFFMRNNWWKFKNYHKIFKKFRKGLVSCIGILY